MVRNQKEARDYSFDTSTRMSVDAVARIRTFVDRKNQVALLKETLLEIMEKYGFTTDTYIYESRSVEIDRVPCEVVTIRPKEFVGTRGAEMLAELNQMGSSMGLTAKFQRGFFVVTMKFE